MNGLPFKYCPFYLGAIVTSFCISFQKSNFYLPFCFHMAFCFDRKNEMSYLI